MSSKKATRKKATRKSAAIQVANRPETMRATAKPATDEENFEYFFGQVEYDRLKDGHAEGADLLHARTGIFDVIMRDHVDPTDDESRRRKAHRESHFLFAIEQSMAHLPNYATLDHKHIHDIINFISTVKGYINEPANTRPINWMMLAKPGEGKSHFIDCIAKKLQQEDVEPKVEAITFNMACMRNADDLAAALDRARNVTVEGKLPLLFLDEFDSDQKYFSLLLPLLWDGEMEFGSKHLSLGRAIIVLAGSDPFLPEIMAKAGSMKDEETISRDHPQKLVDLFSRINGGVIRIPSLRVIEVDKRDRRIDKVCVAIALLRRQFMNEGLMWVPIGLLRFIHNVNFKYGVRSIQHLVDLLRRSESGVKSSLVNKDGILDISGLKYHFTEQKTIQEAGLVYHLIHPNQVEGIREDWRDAFRNTQDRFVPVWCNAFRKFGSPSSWSRENCLSNAHQMVSELQGELKGGFIDLSHWAGIEPLHITMLQLSPDDGEWIHGDKEVALRHVFFNLRTLQQILVEYDGHPNTSLKGLGRKMGVGFGQDFVRFLQKIGEISTDTDIQGVIDHWCKFDVSGGWGSWKRNEDSDGRSGELHIRNNFLAVRVAGEATQEKSRFCRVMEGYIESVLGEIVRAIHGDHQHSVTVEETECGTSNPKTTPCIFQYTITAD